MSTYQKRLRRSIQRIAEDSPALSAVLKDFANRGAQGSSVGSAASDAEESRLCCDGSTSGSANPGTSERDPDASSQDGLDPNDPAKLTNGEGSLTGLTDCATGEPVCMDGAGFIPPDGWDEPADPPIDESVEYQEYWRRVSQSLVCGAQYSSGAWEIARKIVQCSQDFDTNNTYQFTLTGVTFTSETTATVYYDEYRFDTEQTREISVDIERSPCQGGEAASCTDPDVVIYAAEEWPSDGCVNLAIIDGAIVGSKYDPDQDGSYSVPRDSIDLCDGNGNQISLAPSASGGWKTIDAINGGDGYLYDSSGTQIARISADEYSDPNV